MKFLKKASASNEKESHVIGGTQRVKVVLTTNIVLSFVVISRLVAIHVYHLENITISNDLSSIPYKEDSTNTSGSSVINRDISLIEYLIKYFLLNCMVVF